MNSALALLEKLLRPPRILLAEDDEAVGRSIAHWLDSHYECVLVWARTGTEALAAAAEVQQFDLVFLNLRLPGISGTEVLRRIKAQAPSLPVVLITGFMDAEATEAFRLGIVGVMAGPIDANALDAVFATYKIKARTREAQVFFHQTSSRQTEVVQDECAGHCVR